MATQVVTILVRQVGAQATAQAIRAVGQQSRTAAASVKIFTAALAAIGSAQAVTGLFRLQDVYTRVGNQLRFATGSQAEFNAVQQAVLQVANETRAPLEETALLYRRLQAATKSFGVSQADVLNVVEGLNTAILVSGANAQEARGGLTQFTQALQSGRLAGDELRSLLENITPLAESVAKNLGLTLGQLREQAKNIPVDVLFAAVQKSATEFNEKLKDVEFSASQTFNVLRNNLLTALDVLDNAVGATEGVNEAILALAKDLDLKLANAIAGALNLFGQVFRGLADIVDALDSLGAKQLPTFSTAMRAALLSLSILFQGFANGFLVTATAVAGLVSGFLRLGEAAGVVSSETAQASEDVLKGLAEATGKTSDSLNQTSLNFEKLIVGIKETGVNTKETADQFRLLGDNADVTAAKLLKAVAAARAKSDFDLTRPGAKGPSIERPEDAKKRLDALAKILALTNQLRIAEQKTVDPINAKLEKLRQQSVLLNKLAVLAKVEARETEAAALIRSQVSKLVEQQGREGQKVADQLVRANINAELLRTFSKESADELERAVEAALKLGGGLAQSRAIDKANDEADRKIEEQLAKTRAIGEGLVEGIADPLGAELRGVLEGEAFNFAEVLASASANLLQNSFDTVVDKLSTAVGKIFEDKFGTDSLGAAGLSAAIGVGIGLIGQAFKSTSSEVSNNLAKSSAVQDVQATRGVVAGPTNIPIFQVGESLEAAFIPTNSLLIEIRDGIFGLLGVAPSASSGGDSGLALQRTTPSLI